MIFLIYKIILEIYKIDGGENFETSNFYKNRLKTRVLRKNNHKKWIVDFVDSSSRGDLHNKLTQFSITGQLLWKMSSSSCLWAKFGATRKQLSIFFWQFHQEVADLHNKLHPVLDHWSLLWKRSRPPAPWGLEVF